MSDIRGTAGRPGALRLIPLAGAALALAAGAAIILGSQQLPASRTADVGGGRLPLLIGIAIMALALAYGVQQFLAPRRGEASEAAHVAANAASLLGLLIAYSALIPFAGMLVATALFMMAVMIWLDGPSRWLRSALVTIGFVAIIQALFTWVIATPLP